ncbi:Rv3235 family protein [Streptomyces althioticus]|nr:Rv3235 family protein [Streptomyces sp. MNU103]
MPSGTRHRRPGGSPANPGAAPVGAPADHGRHAGATPPEVPRRAEGGAGTAAGSGTRVASGTQHRRPGGSPANPGAAPVGAPADHGRHAGGTPPEVPRRAEGGAVSARPGGVLRGVPQPRPTDRFAELLVAVLSGQRPVHAMLRHSAGQAYDELIRLAERGPLRTRGARPVVRDIGWFVPREGAIEAFARIGAGDRLRAMAFRLERGRDLRWRCTAVELGGPR